MNRSNRRIIILILIGMFLLSGCDKVRFNTFQASEDNITTEPVAEVNELNEDDSSDKKNKDAETDSKEDGSNEKAIEKQQDEKETTEVKTEEITPTPNAIQPVANIDLPVYTVNVDSGEIETVTALIPEGSKITPELIVEIVTESMADNSIEVGIESVKTEGTAVIVSFEQEKAPFSNKGAGYELAILDAIAQSLVDNLKDYNKVIYRVEGKAYESGHIALGMEEVYLGDN